MKLIYYKLACDFISDLETKDERDVINIILSLNPQSPIDFLEIFDRCQDKLSGGVKGAFEIFFSKMKYSKRLKQMITKNHSCSKTLIRALALIGDESNETFIKKYIESSEDILLNDFLMECICLESPIKTDNADFFSKNHSLFSKETKDFINTKLAGKS